MSTPEQWLAYGDDLPLELAKVLTPGPWKHDTDLDRYGFGDCKKCGDRLGQKRSSEHCSVPDPIKIDWNTAMEWRDKTDYGMFEYWLNEVWKALTDFDDCFYDSYDLWKDTKAQPKHYLIAAAMAVEGKKNE